MRRCNLDNLFIFYTFFQPLFFPPNSENGQKLNVEEKKTRPRQSIGGGDGRPGSGTTTGMSSSNMRGGGGSQSSRGSGGHRGPAPRGGGGGFNRGGPSGGGSVPGNRGGGGSSYGTGRR